MKSPSSISGGSAGLTPPPPLSEFFLVLPDGSCTPATPETCRLIMKQARSETRKQAKIKRHEKVVELQMALEDRAAARRLERELAEMHRGSIRWAGRFKIRSEPPRPARRTSPVVKHGGGMSAGRPGGVLDSSRPPSSWVVDGLGMKGIIWQQSYCGRKSPGFRRGAARAHWDYIVRDEAVLLGPDGEPVIVSNMGEDWVEIGAAWQAMEDATTRANGKVQIRCIAPFDSDMSEAEMVDALTHFCTTVLDPLDLPYSAAIHRPPPGGDSRNFHPHIALSLRPMRRVEPYCWDIADEVCGELDGRDGVQMLRHLWSQAMSEAAERAGSSRRYTGFGYSARGLDLDAGEHLGEARSAIVARGGQVWAHERNRITNERNALRRAVRDADRKIAALTTIRDAALARIAQAQALPVIGTIIRAAPPVSQATMRPPSKAARPASTCAQPCVKPAQIRVAAHAAVPARTSMPADAVKERRAARPPNASPRIAGQRIAARLPCPVTGLAVANAPMAEPRRTGSISAAEAQHRNAHTDDVSPAAELIGSRPRHEHRTRRVSTPVPPATPLIAATPSPTSRSIEDDLLHRLAGARAHRERKRVAKRRRDRQMLLSDTPTLADRPRLDLLEAFPVTPAATIPTAALAEDHERLRLLMRIDAYVADYGGEELDIGTAALKAIDADDAWLARPWVQRGLAVVRARQQAVVAAMVADADARLLAYAKAGTRFWPRDLDANRLRRLDRWASDPGFQQDVFDVERRIYRAHQDRDAAARSSSPLFAERDTVVTGSSIAGPLYADGFGGWSDTPRPTFVHRTVAPRIAPFDIATGAPSKVLLRLLHHCGTRPGTFAFADDGKLTTLPGASKTIEPLLQLWRDDPRVEALVVETVTASRAAGEPVWPEPYRGAILQLAASVKPHAPRRKRRRVPPVQGLDR